MDRLVLVKPGLAVREGTKPELLLTPGAKEELRLIGLELRRRLESPRMIIDFLRTMLVPTRPDYYFESGAIVAEGIGSSVEYVQPQVLLHIGPTEGGWERHAGPDLPRFLEEVDRRGQGISTLIVMTDRHYVDQFPGYFNKVRNLGIEIPEVSLVGPAEAVMLDLHLRTFEVVSQPKGRAAQLLKNNRPGR